MSFFQKGPAPPKVSVDASVNVKRAREEEALASEVDTPIAAALPVEPSVASVVVIIDDSDSPALGSDVSEVNVAVSSASSSSSIAELATPLPDTPAPEPDQSFLGSTFSHKNPSGHWEPYPRALSQVITAAIAAAPGGGCVSLPCVPFEVNP